MADASTQEKPPKGKGARASIQVEGEVGSEMVEDVLTAAGGGKGKKAAEHPAALQFARAIRTLNLKIVAARLQPQTLEDGTPLGDDYEIRPHGDLTEKEIIQDISGARGGRKWHVAVVDEDDHIVAAKTLMVPGEPQLDPSTEDLNPRGGGRRGPMSGEAPYFTEPGVEETAEEKLAKDPEIIKAKKEVELLKINAELEAKRAELDESRARRAAAEREMRGEPPLGAGNGKHREEKDDGERLQKLLETQLAPLKEENARLRKKDEERDSDERRRRELDAVTGPLKASQEAMQKTLEALTAKLNQPAPAPQGPSLADQLQNLRRDWKEDMQQYVNTAVSPLTTQLNQVATAVNTLLQGKGNDMATQALVNIATKGGGAGGPAPQDPFTMMARMIQTMKEMQLMTSPTAGPSDFGSLVVEKFAELTPDVLSFIKDQSKNPGGVTLELLDKKMREYGNKLWAGMNDTIKKSVNEAYQGIRGAQAAPAPALPAPVAAPPQQPPVPGVSATQVIPPPAGAPVNAPGVGAAPAASPVPSAPAPGGAAPEEFKEYKKRVDWVLKGMIHEARLGIREMQWPEKAYGNLPKAIVDKLIEAETDDQVHDAVKDYADPELLGQMWAFLEDAHPQHEWYREWLAQGINWIKRASGALVEDEPVTEDAPE